MKILSNCKLNQTTQYIVFIIVSKLSQCDVLKATTNQPIQY